MGVNGSGVHLLWRAATGEERRRSLRAGDLMIGSAPDNDLVFPGRRKVILVHGCFWHRHSDPGCKLARMPKSRQEFWGPKLEGNRARDLRQEAALRALGWDVMTVWECELRVLASLRNKIGTFLG